MADVFISYSRKDLSFAKYLYQCLEEKGIDAWVDWDDIPPSTEWLKEVSEAIEQTNAFIFVISQSSIKSNICLLEIAHAQANNKRLIPIVLEDIELNNLPQNILKVNWLFFREDDDLAQAFNDLIAAIKTDYIWVKEHSRIQVRALEWQRNKFNKDNLLRGRDFADAEKWYSQHGNKELRPTELQREYLIASKKNIMRRKKIAVVTLVFALLISAIPFIMAIPRLQENVRTAQQNRLDSALIAAITSRDMNKIEEALEKGADMNRAQSKEGLKPLHLAILYDDTDLALFIIEKGIDLEDRGTYAYYVMDKQYITPLQLSVLENNIDFVALLINEGVDVNAYNTLGKTALEIAIENDYIEVMVLLIEAGAKVNNESEHASSPLHRAVNYGRTEAVLLLIETGADVNKKQKDQITPLHLAAIIGDEKILTMLLEAGAQVNALNIFLWTPLHFACNYGNQEAVLILLDKTADPYIMSEKGWTPLHIACINNNSEVATVLLVAGVDPNVLSGNGDTPLNIAKSYGYEALAMLLRQYGGIE